MLQSPGVFPLFGQRMACPPKARRALKFGSSLFKGLQSPETESLVAPRRERNSPKRYNQAVPVPMSISAAPQAAVFIGGVWVRMGQWRVVALLARKRKPRPDSLQQNGRACAKNTSPAFVVVVLGSFAPAGATRACAALDLRPGGPGGHNLWDRPLPYFTNLFQYPVPKINSTISGSTQVT